MRPDDDLAVALRLADIATDVALGYFKGEVKSKIKADGSPVGEADLEVERRLLAELTLLRPDDAVLSEECGSRGDNSRRWILDPVDGTVNFLAGDAQWGTHVALEVNGEVVLGVVTRPVLGTRYWAARGGGAFRSDAVDSQPKPLRLSRATTLAEATVTVWPPTPSPVMDAVRRAARWIDPDFTIGVRFLEGEIDAILAQAGGAWDHAPFVVLTEEAGGRFRDPQGGRRIDLGGAVYSNGHLEAELDELLAP